MRKKKRTLSILFLVLILLVVFSIFFGGYLFSLSGCDTGNFSFKGINIDYKVCPNIGKSTKSCGSGDRWIGINNNLNYDENEINIQSDVFQYRCNVVNAYVMGNYELVFDIDMSKVKRIDFEGYIKHYKRCDDHGDCSSSSVNIGIKKILGDNKYIYDFPFSYSCDWNCNVYTSSTSFSLIKSSSGWVFRDLEGHVNTVDVDDDGKLVFVFSSKGLKAATGTLIDFVLTDIHVEYDISVPEKPSSTSLKSILLSITDWFMSLLDKLKHNFSFSITGSETVSPGSIETYHIELVADTPIDTDYTDGTYQVRYCNAGLVDSAGNILSELGASETTNTCNMNLTITVPDDVRNYAIVGVMTEFNGVYNSETKLWEWSDETVIKKEALSLTSKAPIPVYKPVSSPLSSIIKFFENIWNWFKNLF